MQIVKEFSKRREKEAIALLKELDLKNKITEFGEIFISGSVKHHMVIKPDIDLIIITKKTGDTLKILDNYFDSDKNMVRKWVENRKSLGGKSIHIFYKDKIIWKLDILIVNKKIKDKYEKLNKASLEKRMRILKLKYHFYKKKLKLPSLSTHIYDAVISDFADDIQSFYDYLKKLGITKKDFKKDSWEKELK